MSRRRLATDVFVLDPLPDPLRGEWRRALCHFACRCGYTDAAHPLCAGCGIAIGPDHVRRSGVPVPVDVYADRFDAGLGVWTVGRQTESRTICLSCLRRVVEDAWQVVPVRRVVRARTRMQVINDWRVARGLGKIGPDFGVEALRSHLPAGTPSLLH